jgi:hypothetical protein
MQIVALRNENGDVTTHTLEEQQLEEHTVKSAEVLVRGWRDKLSPKTQAEAPTPPPKYRSRVDSGGTAPR